MQRRKWVALFSGLVAAGTLAGCSGGGGGGSSNGTLSLGLIDAPVSGVNSIWLEISEIDLKPTNGSAIQFSLKPAVDKDLLSLTPDNFAALLDSVSVPAGHYEWVQLKVDSANSYVLTDNGGQAPISLTVPSGIVRLVSGFTITADQQANFMIDWNARKGLVDPVGTSGYKLQPALRMIDMQQYGTLQGSVAVGTVENSTSCTADGQNLDIGNVVYIYSGSGVTPGAGVTPVATADATLNADSTAYTYKTILSPGPYTVAFTCEANNDMPPGTSSVTFLPPTGGASSSVTIDNGGDVTVDF